MTAGQLGAVLRLRWTLSRNQWRRRGPVERALGAVVAFILVGVAAGGLSAGVALGYLTLAKASPDLTLWIWDALLGGFLVFWVVGVLAEIQRSETLDLQRLLHLPVSPRGLFVLNYLASHLTISVLAGVPMLAGLTAGLVATRRLGSVLLLPLGLAVLFMVTAWTYCLRGWLAAWMVNPRRRRSVVVGITAGLVLLVQAPNVVMLLARDRSGTPPPEAGRVDPTPRTPGFQERLAPGTGWSLAHQILPPLWLGWGARALALHQVTPALAGTLGALLLGGLGLARAYRSTLRFYRGELSSAPVATRARAKPRPGQSRTPGRAWRLPGLSASAQGVARATLRNLGRAPEVRMALASTLALSAAFAFLVLMDRRSAPPEKVHGLMALGSVTLAQLALAQLFFNQFGLDRGGFRSLVLAPIRRVDLLHGKNLALGVLSVGCGLVPLGVLRCLVPVPPLTLLAALCQLVSVALLLAVAGNLASIYVPYRMATGSLKKARTDLRTTVFVFANHLLMPLLFLPVALPVAVDALLTAIGENWPVPANLVLSLLCTGLLAVGYWRAIPGLARCLEDRQLRILEAVTREIE